MHEKAEELLKTEDGREYILKWILEKDDYSITKIVKAKEQAASQKLKQYMRLANELGFRSSSMFGTDKEILQQTKQVLPLVIEDLKELRIFKGTEFEKEYLYPLKTYKK